MKEYYLSRALQTVRQKKVDADFRERNITVFEHGQKPKNGLLLVTHPTIEDSKILRAAAPDVFTMVTADTLNKTPYESINRFAAILEDGQIKRGAVTHLIYCDPVAVPESILGDEKVPEDDLQKFAEEICRVWADGLAQAKIT